MILTFSRIVMLLPLVWTLGLAPALAASKNTRRHASTKEAALDDFARPVATFATPDRNVAVFRLVRPETSDWTYMIIRVDGDGTRVTYGDDQTVGSIVSDFSFDLLRSGPPGGRTPATETFHLEAPGRHDDKRCAKAAGWRFETTGVRVNYCSDGMETARIERAIDLLDTAPEVTP